MDRLLISNNHLAEFGGSEMVTLELVEEFAARGWQVDVYSSHVDGPFDREFDRLVDSGEVRLLNDASAVRELNEYRLLWIHHNLLPEPIIEALTAPEPPAAVWHHMSPLPGLESPLLADIENTLASVVTHNSPESGEALREYGVAAAKTRLLPNPAPRLFTESALELSEAPALRRIAFISNHPPEEVRELRALLEESGIEVTSIGGSTPQRVTPDSFEGIDAVLSIGKSVQYALCLGIPAFVYDHFGGDGWLTPDNFEAERKFNFSGRATRRVLTAEDLLAEITDGFADSARFAREQVEHHREEFSLRRHIGTLLSEIDGSGSERTALSPDQARRWATFAELQRSRTVEQRAGWAWQQKLETDNEDLRTSLARLQAENASMLRSLEGAQQALRMSQEREAHASQLADAFSAEKDAMRASKSYRLGNALLSPVKRITRR